MSKRVALITVFLLISQFELFSQNNVPSPFYVSLNIGGFISAREGFSEVYDSRLGFSFGGGLGLPLSSQMYLTGRATYFSKSGVPFTYNYHYDRENGDLTGITRTKDGSATYKQWMINGGLEYKIPLSDILTLYPMAGLTYSKYTEESKSSDGRLGSTTDASGMIGYYAGTGLEGKLNAIPLTVFAEAYYNFLRQSLLGITGNVGGANLNAGVRYYLGQKKSR
ncbi:MAG: hypothetical protein HF314_02290 [Ignavibacteria bacterium]|jgi:hypothetical protein|nr:hypothetical protein [Ignavibacteria bacterium]MCU7501875.1 hypothetical protein [Ignavibacteria bacterium]MCU7514779.1 hypothetical protein [Ignavibacteria bacterium]